MAAIPRNAEFAGNQVTLNPALINHNIMADRCQAVHLSKQIRYFCTSQEKNKLEFSKARALELFGKLLKLNQDTTYSLTNFWSSRAVKIIFALAVTAAALILIPNSGFLFIALKVVLLIGVILFFVETAIQYAVKDRGLDLLAKQKNEVEEFKRLLESPEAEAIETVIITSVKNSFPSAPGVVYLKTADCPLKHLHRDYRPAPAPA